jgi:hypothetical protein
MQLIITSATVATMPGMYCKNVKGTKQAYDKVSAAVALAAAAERL